MNETTKEKKCIFGTTIKKLDKKIYQYSIDNKSILFNTENGARKDFKINNMDVFACASKPYISLNALINSQNQTIKQFKEHLNFIVDKLNTYNDNELIKNTDFKINSKFELEKFIYGFLNSDFDHVQDLVTGGLIQNENTKKEYKQILDLICAKYENEQTKEKPRSLITFLSDLNAWSGANFPKYREKLLNDIENKYKTKTEIVLNDLDINF